jgi:hypothetical protein
MIAERYVGMRVVGNKIFREFDFVDVPVTKAEIEELASVLDDPSSAFECYGVAFDFNDDVVDVDIDMFVEQINDELKSDPDSVSEVCKDLYVKFNVVRKRARKGFHLIPNLELDKKKGVVFCDSSYC